ncbi:YwaF family protein [Nesterenkonia ebinurensis]|uniref:YwaF family protein n=1 Tax=Nesterenkonia ebinurensis TaxID=2608252 RepID=UPI00123DC6A3|nr:TIGR02206 family membrane protein [Nesterenkonia ebinurensis]
MLFDAVHCALLAATSVLSVLVVWATRRARGTNALDKWLRCSGWVLLICSVLYTVWLLLPGNWHVADSLPLHYSDVLRFITAVALIWRLKWAVMVSYFWGLTLNPQAMITPHPTMLVAEPVQFTFYWGLHIAVWLAPLALIWGAGHRPDWKGFCLAYLCAFLWAIFVMPINAQLGTNYGFVNRPPDGASLMDFLGPWPVYLVWIGLMMAALWAAMTWPWTRRRSRNSQVSSRRVSGSTVTST